MKRSKILLTAASAGIMLWTSGMFDVTTQAPTLLIQAVSGEQTQAEAAKDRDEQALAEAPTERDEQPLAETAIGLDEQALPGTVTERNEHALAESVTELGEQPLAETATTRPTLQSSKLAMQEPDMVVGSLSQALDHWMEALAADPRFWEWDGAERAISPLGPGTHGWVVILSRGQQEIGYLIIHAEQDGSLRLSEYGTGSQALFSLQSLRHAAQWNGLMQRAGLSAEHFTDEQIHRLYSSSAEAVFVIDATESKVIINAKNGEWYALEPAIQLEENYDYLEHAGHSVQHVRDNLSMRSVRIENHHLPEFDAFERTLWLDGEELVLNDFHTLASKLDQGDHVLAVTYAFDKILLTWPIIGYHLWNGEIPYLIISDEGERYIPFDPVSMTFYTG